MVQVCQGAASKQEMMQTSLDQYKQMFEITRTEFNKVVDVSWIVVFREHSH